MFMPNGISEQIKALEEQNSALQASYTHDIEVQSNKFRTLVEHADSLKKTVFALQASTDSLTNTQSSTNNELYVGTTYKSYAQQVSTMWNKYNLQDDWGCMTAKNIVDVRSAFMVGRGVQAIKRKSFKGNAERELKWIKDFINLNNIDEDAPQNWTVGAELEGKVLLRLMPRDPKRSNPDGQIRVLYVPWNKYNYTIVADEPDLYKYIKAYYSGTSTRPDNIQVNTSFNLKEEQFIYRRFGGTADLINETPSKTAFVLRLVEDLDKELWDWRKINSLFSAPTPVFTVETKQDALDLNTWIKTTNWRIGKYIIVAGGDMKLVTYTGEGYTTIQNAVESYTQTISGATGVPVHFLGHPELLSNRATAENLLELIELSTGKERKIWVGAYEELFHKAIVMHNEMYNDNLNPDAIDAEIPFTSSQSLKTITTVYLPMYLAGAMSLEQLLSYVSEVDIGVEIPLIEARKEKDEARIDRQAASNVGSGNRANGGREQNGRNQENR